eukprot:TRINITY_DN3720_c1_g1_i8.p3 TRINITY_DN3720_c1_g1~~TRINITY_DN3720_c1_g1_i8.p3  ORF type:complete len:111 (-),score=3.72 TRINITY_DN3720_c1_g1_i8:497-829(-)
MFDYLRVFLKNLQQLLSTFINSSVKDFYCIVFFYYVSQIVYIVEFEPVLLLQDMVDLIWKKILKHQFRIICLFFIVVQNLNLLTFGVKTRDPEKCQAGFGLKRRFSFVHS